MIIYNGLLAVATRSWAYGSYTFFLMSFGLFQAAINGIGYRYLWTGALGWARTSGEGSGMGLAIVKRIVEQHQGSIELQTQVGLGTSMTVSLPYQTA